MVHLMAYTLLQENPLVAQAHDVVVDYDINLEQFSVKTTETGSSYIVNHGDLVGDTFKYSNEVFNKLLEKLPDSQDFVVLVTNSAQNSIHLVCEANRLLY